MLRNDETIKNQLRLILYCFIVPKNQNRQPNGINRDAETLEYQSIKEISAWEFHVVKIQVGHPPPQYLPSCVGIFALVALHRCICKTHTSQIIMNNVIK